MPARRCAMARYLSELNQGRFTGLKAQTEQLAMARAHEDLSKKFRYNQRRELRLLEEAAAMGPRRGRRPDCREHLELFSAPGASRADQVPSGPTRRFGAARVADCLVLLLDDSLVAIC